MPPRSDRPDIRIQVTPVVILAGTSVGTIDGEPVELSARQALLNQGRASMHFRTTTPTRGVRLLIDEDRLPEDALVHLDPHATLKYSPLVNGVVDLISGLLQVSNTTVDPHDATTVSEPLVALQASLLDEALHQRQGTEKAATTASSSRREPIEAYIEAHLADPTLTVGSVAAALGLSTRSVHAA